VKNWVAARNTTFKIADVEDLARQKFDSITSEMWSSVCEHVDKFVDEYLVKEHIMDHLQDEMEFMVNTGDSDKESSICSESDDDYSDVWGSRSCIIND
jgi:hypothetical protein